MAKRLDNLTAEELGKLFPVMISEPDPSWILLYREEESMIIKSVGKENILRIEHIGSTAVPGLKAKPVIDILLEIPSPVIKKSLIRKLSELNYHFIPRPENPAPHMMFVKGYTPDGFAGQAYHVHVRYNGDWDEPYFRDYLKVHTDIAKKYEKLKIRLAKKFRNDRDGYTEGKTDFIKCINGLARNNEENQVHAL